mmetsp:Transcript_37725/g.117604  ORF Transcript_37725/g.117604 Transcript_37725/m.117604 type:complete len:211 (-) Transcript_37725:293-925(-)
MLVHHVLPGLVLVHPHHRGRCQPHLAGARHGCHGDRGEAHERALELLAHGLRLEGTSTGGHRALLLQCPGHELELPRQARCPLVHVQVPLHQPLHFEGTDPRDAEPARTVHVLEEQALPQLLAAREDSAQLGVEVPEPHVAAAEELLALLPQPDRKGAGGVLVAQGLADLQPHASGGRGIGLADVAQLVPRLLEELYDVPLEGRGAGAAR